MRFTGAILALAVLTGCVSKRTSKLTAIGDEGQSAMASRVTTASVASAGAPTQMMYVLWNNYPGAWITGIESSTTMPPQWTLIALVTNTTVGLNVLPVPKQEQKYFRAYHPSFPGHFLDGDEWITNPELIGIK